MIDVLSGEPPPPNSRVHAEVSIRAGGSAVNAAISAQAAGAAATVIGRIGDDPSGDFVTAALSGRGVEARLARDRELTTGAAVALGSSVIAHRGANARLSPEDIPDVIAADALFVSGFALFQSGSELGARAALERFAGPWAAVDLASPKLAADARLDGANVVLATADEARALTGSEPDEAARTLAAQFAVVCIKLGAAGAIAAQGDRIERAAADPVERGSAFGAGDAFGGALLVALARGAPLGSALELACEAGARAAVL
jgi:ribokinase